ncbi:MAG: hypothetical protein BWY28_02285 [bacterium ADurb.Bin236]|nr:MAG: hypothetical protein BWY28_02285 [bacterium ADurb.Bin236]HOY64056.1 hypothetical protein [bacterium]
MTEELYYEKLNWFKENEKPEVVLFITDNEPRTRIVIAWQNTKISISKEITPLNTDIESEVWDWLWENTEFSLDELSVKSVLSSYDIEKRIKPLIANRILYPDGTVNSFVQRYLREQVLKLFDAKHKKTATKRK